MSYMNSIRDFIVENFLFGEDNGFTEETSFLESGMVDSTGILEIINFLEETYHIVVEDNELIPENLDSLKNLDRYLNTKLGKTSTQT
jgi:acyl carrier protein